MGTTSDYTAEQIKKTVLDCLGEERVRSVSSKVTRNLDGAVIRNVKIVLNKDSDVSIEDIDRVFHSLWSGDEPEREPFPIVNFFGDPDIAAVSAQ